MLKLDNAQNFGAENLDDTVEGKAALEATNRADRISMNDLETIPIGLIMSWAAITAPASFLAQIILMIVFTLSRIAHTYCYTKGLQPWRTLTYLVSIMCNFGFAINGIVGVLKL